MAITDWPCTICCERHSPTAHILDEGELRYIQLLIDEGTVTVPNKKLYRCDECSITILGRSMYDLHMRIHRRLSLNSPPKPEQTGESHIEMAYRQEALW